MPIAPLRISIPSTAKIDETAGIVYGCKLSEGGVIARFKDLEGKSKSLEMTPALIDELYALASEAGRLDAYWTHDRLKKEDDYLHDSVAVWRNFRKEDGNLVADLHLEPSPYRERILWKAQHDPTGIMTSLVFEYQDSPVVRATSIHSGDLVRFGASTTSLLSQDKQNKPMEPKQLIELLANAEVKTAFFSAMLADDGVKKQLAAMAKADDEGKDQTAKEKADKEAEEAALAAEKEAGVTDADKKPDDDTKPAALRAQLRIARATDRKIAAMAGDARVAAEAALTAKLGNNKAIADITASDKIESFEQAKVAAMASGKTEAEAIRFVAATKPELYNTRNGGVK